MLNFYDLIVFPESSLRAAMEKMTRNRKGVLFISDDSGRLLGVLSDGDVRRSLLDNTLMLAPVTQIMNTDPVTSGNVSDAEKILAERPVLAVPVVSGQGMIQEILVQVTGKAVSLKPLKSVSAPDETVKSLAALAIIPARGNSKRIPRKNLQAVGGKPLLAWAVLAAKAARHVEHTLISTDNDEIARTAKQYGAEAPWLRPAHLSEDDSKTLDVILHALEWAVREYHPKPEYAVLLEPTAPLRQAHHIDEALMLLAQSGADSVVSVCQVPHAFHPEEMLAIEQGMIRPFLPSRTMDSRKLRGEQPPAYIPSGHVYAFRIEAVLKNKSLYGKKCLPYLMDWDVYLDVDTPADLRAADLKLRQGHFGEEDI